MSKMTVFVSGGSRGVGLEVAKRFAKEGANIVITGKTVEPHPKLPGTLSTALAEIEAAGANQALALACDVRNLDELKQAIDIAGQKFGQIDLLVNNASALYLLNSSVINPSKFNLMHEVIVRGSFFAAQFALPYLSKAPHPRIIHLAPKISLDPKWFAGHTAYTMFKYSSAMLVIGLAEEFKEHKIAVNAVWPKTLLATAAVQNLLGGDKVISHSRHPRIVADAIYHLIAKPDTHSGQFHLDEELIIEAGLELGEYSMTPGAELINDLYID